MTFPETVFQQRFEASRRLADRLGHHHQWQEGSAALRQATRNQWAGTPTDGSPLRPQSARKPTKRWLPG